MNDLPRTVKILNRIVHNDDNVTLHLADKMGFYPGQFLMVWVPGLNEKPFSISGSDSDGVLITVRRRGRFSGQLIELQVGDSVGVRGPYGRSFDLTENCCIVAGGIGLACVAPIADRYPEVPILYGEVNSDNRIYQSRFPNIIFYTDDGSAGIKGFPTDGLEEAVKRYGCNMVYCCGPELMIRKTIDISMALDIDCQVSIERYMKCGNGICGQCACGPVRVCVEGTVFYGTELLSNPDFAKRKLDAAGRWQSIF